MPAMMPISRIPLPPWRSVRSAHSWSRPTPFTAAGANKLSRRRSAARSQQAMRVIGFLHPGSPENNSLAAFRQGLAEVGYVEDRNVKIEYRWAEGRLDRLQMLAAELVRRHVAVIATLAGSDAARAA